MSDELIPVPLGETQVYDRMSDPLAAIKTLGGAIFKSGIFGVDKPEQGEVRQHLQALLLTLGVCVGLHHGVSASIGQRTFLCP